VLVILSVFMIGHILDCASAFSETHYFHLFLGFLICVLIAFSLLLVLVYRWLRAMLQSTIREITDMSKSDLNINVILIPAVLFGMGYVILCLIYRRSVDRDTTSTFLVTFTYIEAAFTVAVFIIQGRFKDFEIRRAQQVRVCRCCVRLLNRSTDVVRLCISHK
jgi:hypothetical protein